MAIPTGSMLDLDYPIVVRIALEPFVTIGRHLILEVNIRNRRADIMRVKVFERRDVFQSNCRSIFDVFDWVGSVGWIVGLLLKGATDPPVVIVVIVRVEGDLLLFCIRVNNVQTDGERLDIRWLPPG